MRSRRTIPVLCTALATVLLGVSAQLSGANCSELKIFGSRVTKMIVAELGPQFERASGYTPVVVADVAAVMKRRIESDEPFDLAVLVDFQPAPCRQAARRTAPGEKTSPRKRRSGPVRPPAETPAALSM